jgi:hypothetical protein
MDLAYFSSMAFYANYSTLQDVYLTLVSVGATLGLQSGDTVTIKDSVSGSSYIYTGSTSNNPTARTFQVYTSGTPSVNIQTTAQNLVSVINQDPNNSLFVAQYISSFGQLPGQMQIFAQNLSQSVFSITSSRQSCWSPTIPSSGTTYQSANVSVKNGLAVSQLSKPESVPPSFLLPVGSPNFPIAKILPVRTALLVVKPEEGVFLVTGTSPQSLTVTTLDTTAFIRGSETLVALNNAGYFFTTQGAMLANESGCEIMSRSVQGDVLALSSYQYLNFSKLAFSVGYQSDNAYILFLQQSAGDTYSTLQYRYNWITQGWTTWNIPCTSAVVNTADDRLYIATPDGYILQERKTFSNQDYADQSEPITIVAVGAGDNSLELTSVVGIKLGDQVTQTNGGITSAGFVVDLDVYDNVVYLSDISGFVSGSAEYISSIHADE